MIVLWFFMTLIVFSFDTFIGIVIGLTYYFLAMTTPRLLGFDLFYPIAPLQWFCQKFINKGQV